jgi:hypothetical protein
VNFERIIGGKLQIIAKKAQTVPETDLLKDAASTNKKRHIEFKQTSFFRKNSLLQISEEVISARDFL